MKIRKKTVRIAVTRFFRGLRVSAAALDDGLVKHESDRQTQKNRQRDDLHSAHGEGSIDYSKKEAQETAKSSRFESCKTMCWCLVIE
jgi:hypothetical protein